jgi:6-phosphogluconolactonase (cycloisomerase 2 family)
MNRIAPAALTIASLFAVGCAGADPSDEELDTRDDAISDNLRAGGVYVLSNEATGNAVVAFSRSSDGALKAAGSHATGGLGSGGGLGSQGALVLDESGKWLFAVNPGSGELSTLRVGKSGLTLVDVVPSGGERPVSVTVHDDLVYVLHAGGAGNISGFTVHQGELTPIAGSTRPLSGDAPSAPAQVQFNGDGTLLVVTEKATNRIDTYQVLADGTTTGPTVIDSSGATPFGFAIRGETLVVSEAFGGAPAQSAMSTYDLSSGTPQAITASLHAGQTAACWVALSNDGMYAYATNTGSASISGFHLDAAGALSGFADGGQSAITGATPTDLDLTDDGRYVYALNAGADSIGAYRIAVDGTLEATGTTIGLPAPSVGLAAR